jgi:multidrug resistance efflux pump
LSANHKLRGSVVAILLAVVSVVFFAAFRDRKPVQPASSVDASEVLFASPGRVEGLSETTEVGAATDGVLKAIYVKEHQFVKKGTLLAEIACDDVASMLQIASAEADGARQARTRLLRGARDEEKRIAAKKTASAQATFAEAKSRLERQSALYKDGEISRAAYDQADRDFGVAEADFQTAVQTEELVTAPPLEEEKARADAEVHAAEARVQTAQERIRKCSISAPIAGTVLRVYARAGESFSTVTPRPLFTLADASGRRVKAEIDERDLGKVVVGQKVIIQADGLTGKKFSGNVASVSAVMGRKSVYTGDPSDKSDRDVLETTIDLTDDAQSLPIGLRVTVQFLSSGLRNN